MTSLKGQKQESSEMIDRQRLMDQIRGDNPDCADCGCAGPQWVNLNIGVILCTECRDVHLSLGRKISNLHDTSLQSVDSAENFSIDTLENIAGLGGNDVLNR